VRVHEHGVEDWRRLVLKVTSVVVAAHHWHCVPLSPLFATRRDLHVYLQDQYGSDRGGP
jgi:hypothetical protein